MTLGGFCRSRILISPAGVNLKKKGANNDGNEKECKNPGVILALEHAGCVSAYPIRYSDIKGEKAWTARAADINILTLRLKAASFELEALKAMIGGLKVAAGRMGLYGHESPTIEKPKPMPKPRTRAPRKPKAPPKRTSLTETPQPRPPVTQTPRMQTPRVQTPADSPPAFFPLDVHMPDREPLDMEGGRPFDVPM